MENNIKKLLRGELIGLKVEVTEPKNKDLSGIRGTIIDETKNLLVIATQKGNRKVVKKDNKFRLTADGKEVIVEGSLMARRPEDRIKEIR